MLIYKDTVKLEFVESGHKHMVSKLIKDDLWTTPAPVTGVTTICSIISKPALMKYPMNKALDYLVGVGNLEPESIRAARQAHVEHSNAGKAAGKVGHAMVEALIKGKQVIMPSDPKLRTQAESVKKAFEKWKADFNPQPIEGLTPEMQFYSLTYDYAGITDYPCIIDGKATIVDFKTTDPSYFNPNGIYAEYFCQLGGYVTGLEEMLDVEFSEGMIVNLPKNGDDYKTRSLTDMGLSKLDAQAYFLNALGLYNMNKQFGWKLNG